MISFFVNLDLDQESELKCNLFSPLPESSINNPSPSVSAQSTGRFLIALSFLYVFFSKETPFTLAKKVQLSPAKKETILQRITNYIIDDHRPYSTDNSTTFRYEHQKTVEF